MVVIVPSVSQWARWDDDVCGESGTSCRTPKASPVRERWVSIGGVLAVALISFG
jgi:hypothetical protein